MNLHNDIERDLYDIAYDYAYSAQPVEQRHYIARDFAEHCVANYRRGIITTGGCDMRTEWDLYIEAAS